MVNGRAVIDRQTIHIHDLAAEFTEFPGARIYQERLGHRTILSAPLLREGIPIGTIAIRRLEVRPFSAKQIQLLETFAAQAVIAIENVRLFQELQTRNRDLAEALEQQMATSEILRVISSSPTDVRPVFDAVAESAARLCQSFDSSIYRRSGDRLLLVAHYGPIPVGPIGEFTLPPGRGTVNGRAMLDGRTVHILDQQSEAEEFPEGCELARQVGFHTNLGVPLMRKGVAIGTINLRRKEAQLFTERQVELLKTFADQAVIAIENVRLFQELQARTGELARSVEELKALGEVSQAVSSTLNLETVLATIVARAVQLSGTTCGVVYEYDEATQEFHLRVAYQMDEELVGVLRAAPIRLGEGAVGRASATRAPVQVPDILDEREYGLARLRPILARLGYRSLLAVPLLREERIVGGLVVQRREPGAFSAEVVNLLQTFATQAAIAIENARLHSAAVRRGAELEALLQAARSVMSGLDLQGILDRILAEAAQISGCSHVKVLLVDKGAGTLQVGGIQGTSSMLPEDRLPLGKGLSGIVAATGQPLFIDDCPNDPRNPYADRDRELGIVTHLGLPIKSRDEVIGVLSFNTTAPRRYTPDEVAYLTSFAAQAGIAIENARMFRELQARNRELTETLERQTATSEILRVISSSPTDIQPVLDAVAESAARLCDAYDAQIYRVDGDVLRLAASYGSMPIAVSQPIGRGWVTGRAVVDRKTIHVHDLAAELETEFPDAKSAQMFSGN